MLNLFKSLGFIVWNPNELGSIHRLIHRNCGYPQDYPHVQKFTTTGLNALRTKNCNLLHCGQQK